MRYLVLSVVYLCLCTQYISAAAPDVQTLAREFANIQNESLNSSVKKTTVEIVPGFETDRPKEINYNYMDFENKSYEAYSSDPEAAYLKKLVTEVPAFDISADDVILERTRTVQNNADTEDILGNISSSYEDCQTDDVVATETNALKSCDEYYGTIQNECEREQIVEVDTKYKYSCNKERINTEKTCSQVLTVEVETIDGDLGEDNFGSSFVVSAIQSPANNVSSFTLTYLSTTSQRQTFIDNFANNDPILIKTSHSSEIYKISKIRKYGSNYYSVTLDKTISYEECRNGGMGGMKLCVNRNVTFYKQTSEPIDHNITQSWEEVCND